MKGSEPSTPTLARKPAPTGARKRYHKSKFLKALFNSLKSQPIVQALSFTFQMHHHTSSKRIGSSLDNDWIAFVIWAMWGLFERLGDLVHALLGL